MYGCRSGRAVQSLLLYTLCSHGCVDRNASLVCQRGLPSLRFPVQGRAQFELYQKLLALGFAVVQAIGALSLLRPYVDDWSAGWLYTSTVTLVAGATVLTYVRPAI